MNAAVKRLRIAAELWAFVLTPIAILLGFTYFGTRAARSLGVLNAGPDFVSGIVAAAILLALTQFWPVPARHRRILSMLWLIRIGVCLGFMLVYEARYILDAKTYFQDGIHLNNPMARFVIGDGTKNVTAIVGLLAKITTSYNAQKLIFSYVGLASVYIFYRSVTDAIGREEISLLYILGMFPSLLLWSSILGKDPLTLLGIAIFAYGATGIMAGRSLTRLIWVAIGLAIAGFFRIWLGVIFLTPLVAAVVIGGRLPPAIKVLFVLLTVPLFLVAVQGFADQFSVSTTSDLVQQTDTLSQSWARGGSAQKIQGGFQSIPQMVMFMPVGAFTALFRPLPGEILNMFGMLAGLENGFILWLICRGILRRGFSWVKQPLLLWTVLTLASWSAVYGFVSYQNLGTAFRFHVQVLPLLVALGLYLRYSSVAPLPRRRPIFATVGGDGLARDPTGGEEYRHGA